MSLEENVNKRIEKLQQLSKIQLAKSATGMVARWGAAAVVATIVQQFIPEDELGSKKKKLQVKIGVWALSGAVAHNAGAWAAGNIGDKLEFAKEIVQAVQKASTEKDDDEDTQEPTEDASTEE